MSHSFQHEEPEQLKTLKRVYRSGELQLDKSLENSVHHSEPHVLCIDSNQNNLDTLQSTIEASKVPCVAKYLSSSDDAFCLFDQLSRQNPSPVRLVILGEKMGDTLALHFIKRCKMLFKTSPDIRLPVFVVFDVSNDKSHLHLSRVPEVIEIVRLPLHLDSEIRKLRMIIKAYL